jgi:hypothetical protein
VNGPPEDFDSLKKLFDCEDEDKDEGDNEEEGSE